MNILGILKDREKAPIRDSKILSPSSLSPLLLKGKKVELSAPETLANREKNWSAAWKFFYQLYNPEFDQGQLKDLYNWGREFRKCSKIIAFLTYTNWHFTKDCCLNRQQGDTLLFPEDEPQG